MPDPNWSFEFNFAQTPETNGFTRETYGSPVIQQVSTGSPANRRVEVNTDNGSVVWKTTQVPSLDASVGSTLEWVASCTGTGNAGIELTFLNRVVNTQLYADKIRVYLVGGNGTTILHEYAVNNVGNITLRVTFDSQGQMRVYRNGSLIIGPLVVPENIQPFQRILWWAEEGGVQIFRTIKGWLGGAMAPG